MLNDIPDNKKTMVYASIIIILCAIALNVFLIFFNPFGQSAISTEPTTSTTVEADTKSSEEPVTTEAAEALTQAPKAAVDDNEAPENAETQSSEQESTAQTEEVAETRAINATEITVPDNLPDGFTASDFQESIANALDSTSGLYSAIDLINSGIDEDGTYWWRYGAANGNGYDCFAKVTFDGSTLSVTKE